MIGFGSIGRGLLPLLERHIGFDRSKFVVIDPVDTDRGLLDERKLRFEQVAITRENYRKVLTPLLTSGPGRGMIINLSVDTSSADLMDLCKDIDCFYIDTVCEPWPGLYNNAKASISQRSNYALREGVLDVRRRRPGGVTAVSCCGANPGMVSWFVKQALLDIARDTGVSAAEPTTREAWGRLAQRLGVKGIHIAERDTQRATAPKARGVFVNTWSVEGFCSEGLQPSELGWGTHEKHMPANGHRHDFGCDAAIYLTQPGAGTKVRSWTPTAQAQHGFLVTHNESVSIADYLTLREGGKAVYRPTCHYAYHPCDDAVLSLHEMAGAAWQRQPEWKILDENEIVDGIDELGVLLYGHAKNAYWYGSHCRSRRRASLRPIRMRPACRSHRRYWLASCGCWRIRTAASLRRTRWTSGAASRSNGPISATCSGATPTGPPCTVGPDCSRRTSTPATLGSSRTYWCREETGDALNLIRQRAERCGVSISCGQ